ncbi:hypothetical protein CK220_06810 [Mesorhizobium sp. WSM3860]|nr:hypothetical protein CK220_06810 [Mesorhizobium sp. WSM3860]
MNSLIHLSNGFMDQLETLSTLAGGVAVGLYKKTPTTFSVAGASSGGSETLAVWVVPLPAKDDTPRLAG